MRQERSFLKGGGRRKKKKIGAGSSPTDGEEALLEGKKEKPLLSLGGGGNPFLNHFVRRVIAFPKGREKKGSSMKGPRSPEVSHYTLEGKYILLGECSRGREGKDLYLSLQGRGLSLSLSFRVNNTLF